MAFNYLSGQWLGQGVVGGAVFESKAQPNLGFDRAVQ